MTTFLKALRELAVALIIAVFAGSASALLLVSLETAARTRDTHPWLLWLLPVAGLLSGFVYHRWGSRVEAGNNRILEEIHEPRATIPLRMAPMVLFGTVVTHLFGGSAGREGTAVQMGGSLADQVAALFRLSPPERETALLAGVAAGFASVFGTPLAGAIFALEFVMVGRIRLAALFPCVVSALAADRICLAWGVHHTPYSIPSIPALDASGFAGAVVAGILFGLAAKAFAVLSHRISLWTKAHISYAPLRPALGGILVAVLIGLLGMRYAGLGIPVLVDSFRRHDLPWDFAVKLVLTALTVGVGFKGGEVTPLFFVGATLGNVIAPWLGLPFPLVAGMGFVAVFGAAAKTPVASTLMAMELFGAAAGPWAAIACATAYLASGRVGIYHGQRSAEDL
jgi:H+/Cl- antiporter ClcA